jgi:flagellar biosynthesis protein FlhB
MSVHGVWSNRFIITAIIQGAIITGLTISIVSIQILFSSKINIIQFLSLSFEGPAKWFFLGYIFYMILVVAIAVTATFYHNLENDMRKSIRGFKSVLAWIHLVGMNVGGAATTLTMIFAGVNRLWDTFSHYKRTWCFFFCFSVTAKYWSNGAIYSTYICICRLT